MKHLIYILAFLIVSCSSPTAPSDEFEPYRIGTWLVTSPKTADYVGAHSKQHAIASADTIIIDSADDMSLTLVAITTDDKDNTFKMTFTDSTLSEKSGAREFDFIFPVQGLHSGSKGMLATDKYIQLRSYIAYTGSNIDSIDDVFVHVMNSSYDTLRTYQIKTNGFKKTIETIIY